VARRWEDEGARLLHIVDLDGAREGRPCNLKAIEEIVEAVGIPVEVGGGIRSFRAVKELFDIGVGFVVLGSVAFKAREVLLEALEEFKDKIVVSIDAREGKVRVGGWQEEVEVNYIEAAKELEGLGVARIEFTDTGRDGTLEGINFEAVKNLCESVKIPVVAAGGVGAIEDIRKLSSLEEKGLWGVIVGKALYDGRISLEEAIEAAENACKKDNTMP